jgi:hypothetical protein
MSYDSFIDYWLAITHIESEEQMLAISSSSYAWQKETDRKKIFSELKKNTLSIVERSDDKVLSSEDAALKLMGMLNG